MTVIADGAAGLATTSSPPKVENHWGSHGNLAVASGALMGTDVGLYVTARSCQEAGALARAMWTTVSELDQCWSRFRSDSELSLFNQRAQVGPTDFAVSDRLAHLLQSAEWAWLFSEGIVDVEVLPELVALGYDRSYTKIKHSDKSRCGSHRQGARNGGYRTRTKAGLGFKITGNLVEVLEPTAIDSGGLGKGLAADLVVAATMAAGATGALANVGGDIGVAGRDHHGQPWRVLAADELRIGHVIPDILIEVSGGIATSSTTRRTFGSGHHIVDPRTGQPARSGLAAVTAKAGSALQAEVAAKTALILGLREGCEFLVRNGFSAILTTAAGRRYTLSPSNAGA